MHSLQRIESCGRRSGVADALQIGIQETERTHTDYKYPVEEDVEVARLTRRRLAAGQLPVCP